MKPNQILNGQAIRRLKNEAIAVFVFSGAILGIFFAFGGQYALLSPQCTTMFLHYNLQYRAGNMTTEQTILNESLREMVGMFDRHPTWKYTIEIQAYAIERLLNEPTTFPGILEMLQRQNGRGQLELICGVYSSQILNAYPGDPVNHSSQLTHEILDQAQLTRSRAMLFQEGQFAPGLAYYLNTGNWEGIDTVIVSEQQLMDFWPAWQEDPPSDVPLFVSRLGDKQNYILRYDYIPRYEAGYYHGWMYWSDAELAIEYDDNPSLPEFSVDKERLKNFEAHYAHLERHGNVFMTVTEWIQHCLDTGYYAELGHYMMSTHWGPTKYNTCYTWFGDNSGNVDDGDMLADNYRGRNVLAATLLLNATYFNDLAPVNQTLVNTLLNQAKRSLLMAMVTDTSGINPNPMEREYGYANIQKVYLNCSQVVKYFTDVVPGLLGKQKIQVDLATGNISTTLTQRLTYTSDIASLDALNANIPLAITWNTTGAVPPQVSIKNAEFLNKSVIEMRVTFPGGLNWSVRNDDIYVQFAGLTKQVLYCPPLVEDLHVAVNRTDYVPEDILNLHIPMSNGLMFVPESAGSETGFAIIHNASQYHIAPRWFSDRITYMTGKIVLTAPFQFLLMPHTTMAEAKEVANRFNNRVSWVIGPNATQMQGVEYLVQYFSSYRGEGWNQEEWW